MSSLSVERVFESIRRGEPLFDLGEPRVAQPCRVVLPPDRGVDQLPGHPRLVALEERHLEGRRRGALQGRGPEAVPVGLLEATRSVVVRRPLEEQGRCATPPCGLDGRGHQRRAEALALPLRYDGQRAQHPDLDQVAARVDPALAEPDVADHDAPLLGHEPGPSVVAEARPDLGDVVAVDRVVGAERGGDHTPYSLTVGGLLGTHLENHAGHGATPLYGAAMEIASLGNRTDLAMLERSGSQITDRGTHLVVRTPDNPTFWWGNFLLLAETPADEERAAEWLRVFEREFPEARHRAIALDSTDGGLADLAPFTALGLEGEESCVMTADAVHEPARPNTDATYRPLASDDDWSQQVELSAAGEDVGYELPFVTARAKAERRLVEAGYGAWWGAFEDDRLLASMGLFTASPGLARFQHVKTHPDARGRGLAGTLVHRVSRYGFDELRARTLVMVADPDYVAIRIYRSVGFADTERQLQAERKPSGS